MKKIESQYRLSSDKNKALDQVFTAMEKDIFMEEVAKMAKSRNSVVKKLSKDYLRINKILDKTIKM
jgi:hypothetical protein